MLSTIWCISVLTYTHRVVECKYASSTHAVVMRASVIHTHGPVFMVCIFMMFKHQCKSNSNCATPLLFALQHCARSNPLGKVIDLMAELSAKIQKEGEDEAKAYDEYVQWCQNAVQDTGFTIKSATKEKGELKAKITELSSEIDGAGSKIEELASTISTNEADMKSVVEIRAKEVTEFLASEKELMEVISAIDRAISILGKEAEKNPASFAQTFNGKVQTVLQSLSLVADAAAFSVTDRKSLLALAQSQNDQGEDEFGAPAAAAYKSHSSGILDVLEDMKEKAESQLADL